MRRVVISNNQDSTLKEIWWEMNNSLWVSEQKPQEVVSTKEIEKDLKNKKLIEMEFKKGDKITIVKDFQLLGVNLCAGSEFTYDSNHWAGVNSKIPTNVVLAGLSQGLMTYSPVTWVSPMKVKLLSSLDTFQCGEDLVISITDSPDGEVTVTFIREMEGDIFTLEHEELKSFLEVLKRYR